MKREKRKKFVCLFAIKAQIIHGNVLQIVTFDLCVYALYMHFDRSKRHSVQFVKNDSIIFCAVLLRSVLAVNSLRHMRQKQLVVE